MKTSDQGLDLLIQREGSRHNAYRDSVGIWTIGVGHTGPEVHEGLVWTDQQIKDAFAKDIERFERAVDAAVKVPIKQNQKDALVSFFFNVGETGGKNSQVVKCINAGNFVLAAASFDNWHIPPEITSRRNGEREQFRGTHFVPTYNDERNAA